MTWMLYGANGYTGELIAREAHRRGLKPLLAGRTEAKIRPLAEELGAEWRVFPLDAGGAVARHLDGVDLLLLAAGPFSATSRPAVDACLSAGVHYLDITGEIPVFEAVHARDDEAKRAGCVLMPGVGFDVVPSDCLAASLKEALPEATSLELAFAAVDHPSAGTTKTIVENLPNGGAVRRDGRIVAVPPAWRSIEVPFRSGPKHAVSIPWGDVSTAYHSTGIPNIVVYMATPRALGAAMKLTGPLGPLLRLGVVQSALKSAVERFVRGPGAEARAHGRAQLWGRVSAKSGAKSVEGTLVTLESYELTVRTALEIAARVRAGAVAPGALTPSRAFGAKFITEFEGCDLRVEG